MVLVRIAAFAAGILLGVGTGTATAAEAADPVTFGVRYFAEGDSRQTYLFARQGGGLAGEAWLDSAAHDGRRARALAVCDRRSGDAPVNAVISVPDGRRITYSAPVGGGCFERVLGYPFFEWKLSVGVHSSGEVPPPPLI
ncbi:hypothetical protein GCM10020369_23790 [Cryptosporangium minutisporangium]|uniref:Secreted protein n=1 Tax=Cryptosporangium minutisporangium TaxID=113569 RepID=A0ABP6SX96_9ACTN